MAIRNPVSKRSIRSVPGLRSGLRDTFEGRAGEEAELRRTVRLYNALSQKNQAIVKCHERAGLLQRICRVLVEHGRFTMAWIGWNDPETHVVSVVARYGDAAGYLDRITVRSDDSPEGRGPMGRALRTGLFQVIHDFGAAPDLQPWRTEAEAARYLSFGSFPIAMQGRTVAALNVYASEKNYFGREEIRLLREAAEDLSFGLDHLELEGERQRGERIQAALYQIAMATLEAPSLHALFERIQAILSGLVDTRNFYVALQDPLTGTISFPFFVDEVDPPPRPRAPGKSLTDLILRTGEVMLLKPEAMLSLAAEGALEVQGAPPVDWLGLPLSMDGRTFGVLAVQSYTETEQYDRKSVEILKFVAAQLAASIKRKQAEENFSRTAAHLRTLLDAIPDLVWVKDKDGNYLSCNHRFEQFFGRREGDIVGKNDYDFVDRGQADSFRKTDLQALESGLPMAAEGRIVFASDGHEELIETVKTPVPGEEGGIAGVLGIARNITERKLREQELGTLNRLYDILSQIGQASLKAGSRDELLQALCNIAIDRGGFLLAWVGWVKPETLEVEPIAKAGALAYLEGIKVYADDRPEGRGPTGICIREGRPFTCQDFRKDPATGPWQARAAALGLRGSAALPIRFQKQVVGAFMVYAGEANVFKDREIALLVEAIEHVSFGLEHLAYAENEQQLQKELFQTQKMESLGSLASGVAHDMNNVLGAILALASAHLSLESEGSPLHRSFEIIRDAAVRGGDMVKSLLRFARPGPSVMQEVDLNALVMEEVRLLERTTLAKVRLDLSLAEDLRPIRGDASALSHVLMNLCVNAVDAMKDGGILRLRTCNAGPDRVEVHVEDSGCGMTEEVMARALDPFFTTKEVGKGTGLGLSMAYTSVKAHQGQLELRSVPGGGTQVKLVFPAIQPRGAQTDAPASPAPGTSEAGLHVLLVDDDDLIQRSTRMLLEVLGHTVQEATRGEAALALLEQGSRPDVVILDMNMPGLGGKGTLPLLRTLRPTLPVFLTTGRADQDALDLVHAYPRVTLLQKPFGLQDLKELLAGIH